MMHPNPRDCAIEEGIEAQSWSLLQLSSIPPISESKQAVRIAAFQVRNALDGVPRHPPRQSDGARLAYLIYLHGVPIAQWGAIGSVILTFLERPMWCQNADLQQRLKGDPCSDPLYPSAPIIYLDWHMNLYVELLCVLPVFASSLLLLFSLGLNGFFTATGYKRRSLEFLEMCVYVIDLLTFYAWNTGLVFYCPSFRLAPYLRALLCLQHSPATRVALTLSLRVLEQVLGMFILLFIYLAFAAWVAVILFPIESKEGHRFFDGLLPGMWTLFVSITTANFPDCMMPAYRENRLTFLFFFVFILFGIWFLYNLILAIVFNTFKESRINATDHFRKVRQESLTIAFGMLITAFGKVDYGTTRSVFQELNHYSDVMYITESDASFFLNELDTNHDKTIDKDEFFGVIDLLTKDLRQPPRPYLERRFPSLQTSHMWKQMKRFIMYYLDYFVDLVLVLALVLTAKDTWMSIAGSQSSQDVPFDTSLSDRPVCKSAFCVIYVGEVALKVLVQGFAVYWRKTHNKFDFAFTMLTLGVTILVLTPNGYSDPKLIRFVALLRVVRLSRFLMYVKEYRVIAHTYVKILPMASTVLKVLFIVIYSFGILGTQLFGGVINKDPDSPYFEAVSKTSFAAAGYYENNFNDMVSAMVTIFELVMVNNWFVVSDAFSAAVGPWARVFFVSVWGCCVVIILNIVVAFIIDSFSRNKELVRKQIERIDTIESQEGYEGADVELLDDDVDNYNHFFDVEGAHTLDEPPSTGPSWA